MTPAQFTWFKEFSVFITCCFQQVDQNFSAILFIGSIDTLTSNPDATIKSKFDIV